LSPEAQQVKDSSANDTFTAACALYVSAVSLDDAALVLRSSDTPTDAVTPADSLRAAMDVSLPVALSTRC
jgi:hypothetical protein